MSNWGAVEEQQGSIGGAMEEELRSNGGAMEEHPSSADHTVHPSARGCWWFPRIPPWCMLQTYTMVHCANLHHGAWCLHVPWCMVLTCTMVNTANRNQGVMILQTVKCGGIVPHHHFHPPCKIQPTLVWRKQSVGKLDMPPPLGLLTGIQTG